MSFLILNSTVVTVMRARDYATVSGYIIVMNEHYRGHGTYYAGV